MSRSLVVTNVLFHISVLLVFLIGLRIGFGQLPSVLASLIMLFSISLYSYGYHLGNTIWNISSGAVWLYIFVHYLGEEQLLKKMSLCTGILIFFNYLIIFYWISLLLLYFLYERGARLSWRDRSIMILKTQYFSIISIILCVLLFYQPGQGNRGTIASIDTILSYPYYIILNFFAFYNGKELFLEIFQFIIGLFLVLSSFYYASSLRLKDNVEMLYVAKISIIIVLVYFVSVLIGVLGFAPSRHILYLAPVLFIMVNLTIYKFYNNYNQKKIFLILMVCLIIVGFTCVHNRLNDTKDKTARINVDNDIDEIVVFDYSYNLVYKKWKTSKSAFFSDPLRFSKGKTYLYISQTTDIKDAINAWKRVVKVKVLYGYNDIGNAYFIAHNPNPKYFNHNRPNNVYLAKFQVAD